MRQFIPYILSFMCLVINRNDISAQSQLNVSGTNPNISLGTFVVVPSNITIATGSSIINNGNILSAGNFTNNGNGLDASSIGTIIFNGSIQNVSGTNDINFYNVVKNTPGSVIIARDETIRNTLILSNGFFDLNGQNLTLNGAFTGPGTLIGSKLSGLIVGGNAGTVSFDQSGTNSNYLKTLTTVNSSSNLTLGNALNITASDGVGTSTYGTVISNGTITTAGNLTLKSDNFGDAIVGVSGGSINGQTNVERYIYARRAWRFLTAPFSPASIYNSETQTINQAWQEGQSPITSQPMSCPTGNGPNGLGMYITNNYDYANGYDWNTTSSPSLKIWNGTQWVAPPSTTGVKITDYAGYYTFIRGDRNVCIQFGQFAVPNTTILRANGELNEKNGNAATETFTNYVAGNFAVFGNPYAAPLDFTKGNYSTDVIDSIFYVLDPKLGGTYGVGDYVTYHTMLPPNQKWLVPGGGTYAPDSPSVIQSGQAFLMKVTGPAVSASFPQNAKALNVFNTTGKVTNKSYTNSVIYTELLLPDDSLKATDIVATIFGKKFQPHDSLQSATKFWNPYENISIWNNNFYAISCRPFPVVTDTVFFKTYIPSSFIGSGKNYTLKIYSYNASLLPVRAWLVDKYLNSKTELNLYDTTLFNFTALPDTNSFRNRFMIVFNHQFTTNPQPVSQATNQNDPNITGVAATINNKESGINIYPNPVTNGKILLRFINMNKGNYDITITNTNGQVLAKQEILHNGGSTVYTLPANASWAAGVYSVTITNKESFKLNNLKLIMAR